MEYIKVVNGIHPNNTYLIYNEKNECLIVDPSIGYEAINKVIVSYNFTVVGILVTHGHYDHLFSVDFFVEKYNVDVYCSKNCISYFNDSNKNLSITSQNSPREVILETKPKLALDKFKIRDFNIETIKTYGHTKTCVTYIIDDLCLTGDFLFKGTVGRTDFADSSIGSMTESLKKISKFSLTLTVLPGHGEVTTLGNELDNNPYFNGLGV